MAMEINTQQTREIMTLNLRGQRFEILRSTLSNRKGSKLAELNENSPSYDCEKKEHYFDINPDYFHCILDAYSLQDVHYPEHACLAQMQQQLDFWGLDDSVLASCCYDRYKQRLENEDMLRYVQRGSNIKGEIAKLNFSKGTTSLRVRAYMFLELPNSSRNAKLWSCFVIFLVIASVLQLMLESLQPCREFFFEEFEQTYKEKKTGRMLYLLMHSRPNTPLLSAEVATTLLLSSELVARFTVSPCKKWFFTHKHMLNLVDLGGVAPLWVMGVFLAISLQQKTTLLDSETFRTVVYALSCMKIFRIFRLFKLINHYESLKLIHLALKRSKGPLLLLVVLLTTMAAIFANLVFIAEINEDNFRTAFHSMWWAMITMTTVGYGDVHPVSVSGYVIGATCAVMGILVIALPVPVIVNSFSCVYECAQKLHRLEKRNKNSSKKENNSKTTNHKSAVTPI